MILSRILPDKIKWFIKKAGIRTYLINKWHFPRNVIVLDQNRLLYFDPFDMNAMRMKEDYKNDILISTWKNLLMKRESTISLDIGSNYGLFTLAAPERSKIYAFEPNPHVSKYLKKSIDRSDLEDTKVVGKAVSNEVSLSSLNVNKSRFGMRDSGSGHLLSAKNTKASSNRAVRTFNIETTTLDNFFFNNEPFHFDFDNLVMKVDVEGYEPAVFKGARNFLLQFERIDGICEFNDEHINRANFSPEEFYAYISREYFAYGYFPHSKYFYNLNGVLFQDVRRSYYKIRPSGPNVHFNFIFSTHSDIAGLLRTILSIEPLPITKGSPVKEQIP